MNEVLRYILISYIAVISLISAVVCIADKHNSKIKGRRRVPEKTLLLLSALGGSAAMLTVMLLIRHKTKKPKFMIGIPVIIILQYAVLMLVLRVFG